MSSPTRTEFERFAAQWADALRRTAEDETEMRQLVEFAGGTDPATIVRAMARLLDAGFWLTSEGEAEYELLHQIVKAGGTGVCSVDEDGCGYCIGVPCRWPRTAPSGEVTTNG